MTITKAQLTRLQTCYAQMCSHLSGYENTREARLRWASQILGRPVVSFSKLSLDAARKLIDAAQGELGHRAPLKATSARSQGRKQSAEDARRAGLDGRKVDAEFADQPELVSAEDIETIRSYYQRLGWGEAQFESWLRSRTSPLRGRKVIRTTADANRVRWALKGMLQDANLWVDWKVA